MLCLLGAAASLAAPEGSLPTTLLPSPDPEAANASTWTSISGDATLTAWCNTNCAAGFCPPDKCVKDGDGAAVQPSPSPKPAAPTDKPGTRMVACDASGAPDDANVQSSGWTACDADGDYYYSINASGPGTWDFYNNYIYIGVQLR